MVRVLGGRETSVSVLFGPQNPTVLPTTWQSPTSSICPSRVSILSPTSVFPPPAPATSGYDVTAHTPASPHLTAFTCAIPSPYSLPPLLPDPHIAAPSPCPSTLLTFVTRGCLGLNPQQLVDSLRCPSSPPSS